MVLGQGSKSREAAGIHQPAWQHSSLAAHRARAANNAADNRVSQQLIPWPERETCQRSSENRKNVDTKDSGVWLLEITNYL